MSSRSVVAAMTAYTLELREAEIKLNQNESPFDFPRELKEQVLARMVVRPWNLYPDFESITLRTAISARKIAQPRQVHPLLAMLPGALIAPIMNRLIPITVLDGVAHDVQQDFEIWQHKVYFTAPILAEGDGPVGKYRQWVKQFYVDE